MPDILDIIRENERLIYKIIYKYKKHFELEDLYQVAVIGIMKAYKNYKQNLQTKFITYAYPYIVGEVLKYVNEYRTIKLSSQMKQLYSRILKAKDALSQKLMREPTIIELSSFLGIDCSIIEESIIANYEIESLDKSIREENENFRLYNQFGYVDLNIENIDMADEISKLPSPEKEIIIARYYDNLSQREVGELLGINQVEVSRKERKTLKRLYDRIAA